MKLKRRNFFALLWAPIAAKFLPKPLPHGLVPILPVQLPSQETIDHLMDEMNRVTMAYLKDNRALVPDLAKSFYTVERRMQILGPEGVTQSDFDRV